MSLCAIETTQKLIWCFNLVVVFAIKLCIPSILQEVMQHKYDSSNCSILAMFERLTEDFFAPFWTEFKKDWKKISM